MFFTPCLFGQVKTDKLPDFFSKEEGNSVLSADIIINEDVTVLYSDQLYGRIHCKKWVNDQWIDFGNFPNLRGYSSVQLTSFDEELYALVSGEVTWTVYSNANMHYIY